MNKEEFVNRYQDEITGLLLGAVVSDWKGKEPADAVAFAARGKFFLDQLRRSRGLLERMWQSAQPAPATKPATAIKEPTPPLKVAGNGRSA